MTEQHDAHGELVAKVGDRIVIAGHHVGEPDRRGLITETRPGGAPPFTVEWEDEEGERLLFPGSDAHIEPRPSPVDPEPT